MPQLASTPTAARHPVGRRVSSESVCRKGQCRLGRKAWPLGYSTVPPTSTTTGGATWQLPTARPSSKPPWSTKKRQSPHLGRWSALTFSGKTILFPPLVCEDNNLCARLAVPSAHCPPALLARWGTPVSTRLARYLDLAECAGGEPWCRHYFPSGQSATK